MLNTQISHTHNQMIIYQRTLIKTRNYHICTITLLLYSSPQTKVKTKHKVMSYQRGIVRTNCLDCLDRTNVFQTKVCVKVFEDLLKGEHAVGDIKNLMI